MLESQETDTATNFALMLATACRDFEAFLQLIRGEVIILGKTNADSMSVSSAVNMSLTKSFVFNVIRAGRICEHGGGELMLDRAERKDFISILKLVLPVRTVNEHGYDRHKKGGSAVIRPQIHLHDDYSVAVDETSLTVLGEHQILMGPLNLRTIYDRVKPYQLRYGLHSIRLRSDFSAPE